MAQTKGRRVDTEFMGNISPAHAGSTQGLYLRGIHPGSRCNGIGIGVFHDTEVRLSVEKILFCCLKRSFLSWSRRYAILWFQGIKGCLRGINLSLGGLYLIKGG